MDRSEIKRIALQCGFKLKDQGDGTEDLHEYVYDFANRITLRLVMDLLEEGVLEGETCNRDGCDGIMERVETDGCCSCRTNPPCSYCVDATYECNKCGFETERP